MTLTELLESVRRASHALAAGLFVLFALTSRAGSEPTTLAELNAWYPAVPADQNAAVVYAEAFALLSENASDPIPTPAVSQKLLALLHRAAELPSCRYPIDLAAGYQTKLPHLAKIKQAAEFLKLEAIAYASKGYADLAVQSIQANLGLARSLEPEPLLISQLVRTAVIALTTIGLERSLWQKPFSDEQLAQLQISMKAAETNDAEAYKRAFIGERCCGLTAFQSPIEFFKLGAVELPNSASEVTPEFESLVASYVKGGTNKLEQIYYLQQMGFAISMSELPFPERLDQAEIWRARVSFENTNGFLISPCLLPAMAGAQKKSAGGVAVLRVAQTVLAIERYRLANTNALPSSLTKLVPQFIQAVPADPFDGKPLRFKLIPKRGYMVYSIGLDRVDDGGIHKPEKPLAGSHYDLAITVLRK
jgi:hypothetical protein